MQVRLEDSIAEGRGLSLPGLPDQHQDFQVPVKEELSEGPERGSGCGNASTTTVPTPESCERRDGTGEEGETEARAWATGRLGQPGHARERNGISSSWQLHGGHRACPRSSHTLSVLGKILSSRGTGLEDAVPGADGRGQCMHKILAPRSYSSCLQISSW